jgi:hypothetical protein
MTVYKNELQIKFEYRSYWSIFDQVMALGLRIFMKICFPDFADIEMKLAIIVYSNELQMKC